MYSPKFYIFFKNVSPNNRSGHPRFCFRCQRMEIQVPIAFGRYRSECQSQNTIHEIKGVIFNVKRAVLRIGVKQVVDDLPGSEIGVIVDNEWKICDVSNIDESVTTFYVYRSNINGRSYEQWLFGVLFWRESMATQEFFGDQRKREQLRWADSLVTNDTGVEDPQAVAAVDLQKIQNGF